MPEKMTGSSLTEQDYILRAKQEWEHTFDAVSDLIFIVDNDHSIVRANRSMVDRMSCTYKDIVGRKCFEVMHDTHSAPAYCPHARLLESGEPQTAEYTVEKFHGIFEVTMSPMFNHEDRLTACVHVARDITEKKQHEELLAVQKKQLDEINRSLESRIESAVSELRNKDDLLIQESRLTSMGEMISNIAHQWRQPLNNIGLIVQGLQLAIKSNELTVQELDDDIAETMNNLQQISETIDDFRNFFSYEEDAKTMMINEIMSRLLSFIEPSLKRIGISVELENEPEVTAEGYPNEYMQAVLNIMLNARDVMLDNQVEQPLIHVRIFQENGHSVVTVCDNGGGINEDVLPKIFDPYFTTKEQKTGSGIGLYMAKMIVEKKMHGSLTARNVNGGAEFRIEV